ncbi:hypothetical protein F5878DRAFT_520128, partial [Lentinula raphanica]
LTPHGNYYSIPKATGAGNSFICFYPNGDEQTEWVAGQIQYIFKQDNKVRFTLRCSVPHVIIGDKPDPFKLFWDRGFEAKMVTSAFSGDLEVVDYDWVVAHTARWELESFGIAVCLNLAVSS